MIKNGHNQEYSKSPETKAYITKQNKSDKLVLEKVRARIDGIRKPTQTG